MIYEEEKGWGREVVFADEPEYCGKFLIFDKEGAKFSMHFHIDKKETWYVQQGKFKLILLDTDTARTYSSILEKGDTHCNLITRPHQLIALEDNSIIIEVSTEDISEDNYRVFPGDSQKEE